MQKNNNNNSRRMSTSAFGWFESNEKKANVSEEEAAEEAKESGLRILMRSRGGAAPSSSPMTMSTAELNRYTRYIGEGKNREGSKTASDRKERKKGGIHHRENRRMRRTNATHGINCKVSQSVSK